MKKKSIPAATEDEIVKCLRRLYSQHKASAKKRKIPFDLSREDHAELVLSNCGYCGAEPSNLIRYNGLELAYNGLDRLDSALGYSKSNIVPSCRFCNTLKGSMPKQYWLDFINDVVELHGGNPPYPGIDSSIRAQRSYYGGR